MSLTAISLFTGAMGLDLGFEENGFDIRVAIDNDVAVCKTIRSNRPTLPIISEDIRCVPSRAILKRAGLKKGEPTVVLGGPPCQPFSTVGRRLCEMDERSRMVVEFIRVVKDLKPRFFVFENVPGLKSAALRHISFYERIKKKECEVPWESRLGSAFTLLLLMLGTTRYRLSVEMLNALDYGAPQKRRRLFIMGARDGEHFELGRPMCGGLSLEKGLSELDEIAPEFTPFPPWGEYLKYVPAGGNWRDLPETVKEKAMGGAIHSSGGRTGFFRRLHWAKPSPTLVSSPIRKATCLAHPDELRPLSIREYAALQHFPSDWKFEGVTHDKYKMIGNAVPLHLSLVISDAIASAAV